MGDVIDLPTQHNPECTLHNALIDTVLLHGAPLSLAQVLGVMDLVKRDIIKTVDEEDE